MRPYADLPDDDLRERSKRADDRLGSWLDALRIENPSFKTALEEAVELDLELERRARS